jgi:FkbM family methyltransferase
MNKDWFSLKSTIKPFIKPVKKLLRPIVYRATDRRYFNGYQIRVPKNLCNSFKPFTNLTYEIEEWEALWKFGEPGKCYLDVGANIGVITVAMSKIAGDAGRVIACEPNPHIYSLLVNMIELNQCNNTLPLQSIVSDDFKMNKFFISDGPGLGAMSSLSANDPYSKAILLPSITVDSLTENDVTLDYIKIDAEGAEYKILTGSQRTLESSRPFVQVEVHGQYMEKIGGSVEALFQFMQQRSYKCVNIPTWREVPVNEFLSCTHCHALDHFTKQDMAYQGYGQVIFIPEERKNAFLKILPRKCPSCKN